MAKLLSPSSQYCTLASPTPRHDTTNGGGISHEMKLTEDVSPDVQEPETNHTLESNHTSDKNLESENNHTDDKAPDTNDSVTEITEGDAEKSLEDGKTATGYGFRSRAPINYSEKNMEIINISPETPKTRKPKTPQKSAKDPLTQTPNILASTLLANSQPKMALPSNLNPFNNLAQLAALPNLQKILQQNSQAQAQLHTQPTNNGVINIDDDDDVVITVVKPGPQAVTQHQQHQQPSIAQQSHTQPQTQQHIQSHTQQQATNSQQPSTNSQITNLLRLAGRIKELVDPSSQAHPKLQKIENLSNLLRNQQKQQPMQQPVPKQPLQQPQILKQPIQQQPALQQQLQQLLQQQANRVPQPSHQPSHLAQNLQHMSQNLQSLQGSQQSTASSINVNAVVQQILQAVMNPQKPVQQPMPMSSSARLLPSGGGGMPSNVRTQPSAALLNSQRQQSHTQSHTLQQRQQQFNQRANPAASNNDIAHKLQVLQEQLRAKQHSGADSPATRNELANIISNIMRLNHFKNNNNNRPFNSQLGNSTGMKLKSPSLLKQIQQSHRPKPNPWQQHRVYAKQHTQDQPPLIDLSQTFPIVHHSKEKLELLAVVGLITPQQRHTILLSHSNRKRRLEEARLEIEHSRRSGKRRKKGGESSEADTDRDTHDNYCNKCRMAGELLMCDKCPRVFHLFCLEPPLAVVPEGEWFCNKCQAEKDVEESMDVNVIDIIDDPQVDSESKSELEELHRQLQRMRQANIDLQQELDTNDRVT